MRFLGSILLILRGLVKDFADVENCDVPLDTDNEGEAGLGGDEERVVTLRGTLGLDDIALGLCVLLGVLGGALLDDLALLLAGLRNLSQLWNSYLLAQVLGDCYTSRFFFNSAAWESLVFWWAFCFLSTDSGTAMSFWVGTLHLLAEIR